MTADRAPFRLARTVGVAVVSAGTGLVAHTVAGGTVSPVAAVAALVLIAAVAWPLTARRLQTAQIVGLLMLAQVAVHGLAPGTHHQASMLLAHVVATGLSAAWLAWGEQRAWAVVLLVVRWVRRDVASWSGQSLRAQPCGGMGWQVVAHRMIHARGLRGPPTGRH